jgi:hypothetical protein
VHSRQVGTDATRVELEISRDRAEQIHGSLVAGGQGPIVFTGWLELISLIERMSGEGQVPPPARLA